MSLFFPSLSPPLICDNSLYFHISRRLRGAGSPHPGAALFWRSCFHVHPSAAFPCGGGWLLRPGAAIEWSTAASRTLQHLAHTDGGGDTQIHPGAAGGG